MSQFSGKCDFYDGFVAIHGDGDIKKVEENLKKLNLYIHGRDGRDHKVKSDTIKDIVKYYPYLESIGCYNKEDGWTIVLASDSFIDEEEREYIQYKIDDVQKYWRKCKREKREFDPEECSESLFWNDKDMIREIAYRIKNNGNKAEFDDLHDNLHEHYRREWFEKMVEVGYTELEAYNWCFKGLFDSMNTIEDRLGRPIETKGVN